MTKEHSAKCVAASRAALQDPIRNAAWRKLLSESIKANWDSGTRKPGNPHVGKRIPGPDHYSAKHFRLRGPRGEEYAIKNLSDFVRTHPQLFSPDDVIGHISKQRARKGLARLFENAQPLGSWKGWTALSIYERRFNDGQDLLDRKESEGN